MIYATYEYYQNSYFGTLLAREEFFKYAKKACAEVDKITFGRLEGLETTEIPDCVRDAVCDVAEKLKEYDSAGGGRIASESNDGFSVSYKDGNAIKNEMYVSIRTYLSNTGFLSRVIKR